MSGGYRHCRLILTPSRCHRCHAEPLALAAVHQRCHGRQWPDTPQRRAGESHALRDSEREQICSAVKTGAAARLLENLFVSPTLSIRYMLPLTIGCPIQRTQHLANVGDVTGHVDVDPVQSRVHGVPPEVRQDVCRGPQLDNRRALPTEQRVRHTSAAKGHRDKIIGLQCAGWRMATTQGGANTRSEVGHPK